MLFRKSVSKNLKFEKIGRFFSAGLPEKTNSPNLSKSSGVQFSKHRLVDFGELAKGDIPDALNYSPENKISKLSNNIKVATEQYSDGINKVSVFIKAGSRYENIDNSGSSFYLQTLLSKGPASMTRDIFNKKLESLGVKIESMPGREIIGFSLSCLAENTEEALALLLETIVNPNFDSNQFEVEKELVYRKNLDVSKDQFEHLNEAIFYTSFRDHMMGQSMYGIRDNIPNLTVGQVEKYYNDHFVGENIVVVVSGDSNHEKVAQRVEQSTKKISHLMSTSLLNSDKPLLTGSVMFQRDDEMYNLNAGVGHLAPAFGEIGHIYMKFFEKIVGTFNANTDGYAHLNTAHKQYNYMHRHLGEMTGVNLQTIKYQGFSDIGLLTSFIHGNDVWGKQMMYINQHMLSYYANNLNQVEVFRARSKIFNELLNQRPSYDLNSEIAKEVFYIGRRVDRTELASRISLLAEDKILKKFAFDNFYDRDIGLALWGPGHNIVSGAYYDKRVQNSTKSDYLNIAI